MDSESLNSASLLTIGEVCERLNYSRSSIYRRIQSGELEAVRLGRGAALRVRPDAVEPALTPGRGGRVNLALGDLRLLDAVADRLRTNQVDGVAQAGLPADLVAVEQSVWKRLSPGRNAWPVIGEFDARVAGLEQRQAAIADELGELRDRQASAPARDQGRLADWELNDRVGERPEAELPAIEAAIRRLQTNGKA